MKRSFSLPGEGRYLAGVIAGSAPRSKGLGWNAEKSSIEGLGTALSELEVQPQSRHGDRPPRLVHAGMVDVLQIEGEKQPAPDVGSVEGFHDVLARVIEGAVAKNEAKT